MPNAYGQHAADDELEQYVLGGLVEPEVAAVEEHLLVCETCRARLEETESFVQAMRSAARKLRAEPPSAWEEFKSWFSRWMAMPTPVWATAAAAVAVVCGLAAWPSLLRHSRTPAAFTVSLEAQRGIEGASESRVPREAPLVLFIDLAEVAAHDSYRIEVVDALGKLEAEFTKAPASGRLEVRAKHGLPAGRHWIRLYAPGRAGALLREFAVLSE